MEIASSSPKHMTGSAMAQVAIVSMTKNQSLILLLLQMLDLKYERCTINLQNQRSEKKALVSKVLGVLNPVGWGWGWGWGQVRNSRRKFQIKAAFEQDLVSHQGSLKYWQQNSVE